ncbi:hypothetical protein A2344_02835 [Candidatus Peregrinibacteria bacterium RIFOXYB12_FULL_41_12]|nr:MAG: hypothetical protein A2244_01575 [Candidatus Peregrinibacteria bacterium RIFOXYA2_FULL_41_18]OGJ48859.1 MAG: hypothetical protein A2344_02835 [Candidatus Peregrinibacteria bacterium RIFOXYB12_FULL_41_12]OGJ52420.1 MAG: hypothetical protein A2336_02380 [Candidatus Peregrinibacteria bacterium RIFOXYB2_FULL_41_88]OGJ53424.1 MAG: hypothetical protein A2448_01920 [Candidatus Peregrinibacteria bacterium RIFOXYC2_FULL_41_22]
MKNIQLKIEGMHCASCAKIIEMELSDLKGISKVNVSFADKTAAVSFDEEKLSEKEIAETIKKAGYKIL